MQPNDRDQEKPEPNLSQAKEALLQRAKELSKKTEERMRKLMEDTKDKSALPADPTNESPPVE